MTSSPQKTNTLAKHERLKSSSEISTVLRNGIRLKGRAVSLYYTESEDMAFAVLVSKHIGSAVERNRAKRWVREIFRTHKYLLPFSCSLLMKLEKHIVQIDYSILKADIIYLLGKIGPGKK